MADEEGVHARHADQLEPGRMKQWLLTKDMKSRVEWALMNASDLCWEAKEDLLVRKRTGHQAGPIRRGLCLPIGQLTGWLKDGF